MAITKDEPTLGVEGDLAFERTANASPKRRGRPRKSAEERLVRRTVLVDPSDLARLREHYGAKSDAEAIRYAIVSILQLAALDDIQHYLAEHGGLDDVYDRTSGKSKLPVHLRPGDIPPEELEPFLDDDAHGA